MELAPTVILLCVAISHGPFYWFKLVFKYLLKLSLISYHTLREFLTLMARFI